MTTYCQTSSLLTEQKLLRNVSCGYDDKSSNSTSSISVAGATRCISQIDYLSNLKANDDVIISSLEKILEFDINEEKYVHYANRFDLSSFIFYLRYLELKILVLYQTLSQSKIH